VQIKGSNREIQIQRDTMPQILKGGPDSPDKVRPRIRPLNEGRVKKTKQPYFIFEEEISRAGCHISLSFRRTRWHDGRGLSPGWVLGKIPVGERGLVVWYLTRSFREILTRDDLMMKQPLSNFLPEEFFDKSDGLKPAV
jgi:hypothetical protein